MVEGSALKLVQLAVERGWRLGLLFLVFCGGALATSYYGIQLPDIVKQWSVVGLLFGVATIVVSSATNLIGYISRKRQRAAQRRAEKAEAAAEAEHILANLAACNDADMAQLETILPMGSQRFQADLDGPAKRLIKMGALLVREDLGGMTMVCELHPAVVARSDDLLKACKERLQQKSRQLVSQPKLLGKFDN